MNEESIKWLIFQSYLSGIKKGKNYVLDEFRVLFENKECLEDITMQDYYSIRDKVFLYDIKPIYKK